MFLTAAAWGGLVASYAAYYVHQRLTLPGLEGYEQEWRWQLAFFAVTRLPFLVLALVVLLAGEWLGFRRHGSEH
jgi:hypothetical protein